MKILVHSNYSAKTVSANFGKAEYSYYFVLAGYLPALRLLGDVVTVANPEAEVDRIFDACRAAGEVCVFLCFTPPHLVPISLRCPTIPVFAWEFSTIPCEIWGDDPRCDWRVVFAHCGRAITLSKHTEALVREAMGADFPVFSIPTVSYETFADIAPVRPVAEGATLSLLGYLFDSAADARFAREPAWPPVPAPQFGAELATGIQPSLEPIPLEPAPKVVSAAATLNRPTLRKRISITAYYFRLWYNEVLCDLLPRPMRRLISASIRVVYRALRGGRTTQIAVAPSKTELTLSGVVYTSVFAPQDGRKNWQDALSGFVQAFRNNPKATLFFKVPVLGGIEAYPEMHLIVSQFAPLKCRVILFAGFLDDAGYRDLVGATTYYVNTSHGEGLCLPLMEFLSAGRPAIAPDHTAMADYINSDIAFVLKANQEHNVWPFDQRDLFKTMRYRLNWESLVDAYEQSYLLAVEHGPGYTAKSNAARAAMREFCRLDLVREMLSQAIGRGPSGTVISNADMVST